MRALTAGPPAGGRPWGCGAVDRRRGAASTVVSNSCARTWRPSRCRPGRYAVSAFLKLASAFAHEAPQWASNSSLARRASSSDRCARREHDRWGRRTPSSSGRCRDPRAAHRGSPLPACQATPSLALPTGGLGADRVAFNHHRETGGASSPDKRSRSPIPPAIAQFTRPVPSP